MIKITNNKIKQMMRIQKTAVIIKLQKVKIEKKVKMINNKEKVIKKEK